MAAYVQKSGFLNKRDKKNNVKRIYMVLRDSFIIWLDSEKSITVSGICSTARCQIIAPEIIAQTLETFKCTFFLINQEGMKLELITSTPQEKDEWIVAIKKSCNYVRSCFEDGAILEQGASKFNLSERIEGWMKMNDKRVFCSVRDGLLMWFNEEPAVGLVDPSKIRGHVNLMFNSFVPLHEVLPAMKEKKSLMIYPPLGSTFYTLTGKSPEEITQWEKVLIANSGPRKIPSPMKSTDIMQDQDLFKAGWLLPKGNKSLWVVARPEVLMWFDKEQPIESTKNAKGSLSLGLAYVGRDFAFGTEDADAASFIVYSSDGINKMTAKSRGEVDEWVYIINECIQRTNKRILQITRASIEKSGWVVKKGKKRWFIIKNHFLLWYPTEQVDGQLSSVVKGSVMIEGLDVRAGKGNTFVIASSGRSEMVITAHDADDRDAWVSSIKADQLFIQQEQQRHVNLANKYFNEFMGFLVRQRTLGVLIALCRCYESEQLISTITALCLSEDRHWPLLSAALKREIDRCEAQTTLFRTDSIATKTTRAYFKLIGSDYLRATLKDLVVEVIQNPANYEVDPQKIPPEENIDTNIKVLRASTQKFLDKIVGSYKNVPEYVVIATDRSFTTRNLNSGQNMGWLRVDHSQCEKRQMRQFFSNLRDMVGQKFPESQMKAVGAFLFLRFLCPSVFSPDGFGLVSESPSEKSRRSLILIAKVLQNTANGVPFGGKEQFMAPLNSFVDENMPVLFDFFDKVSNDPPNAPPPLPSLIRDKDQAQKIKEEKTNHLALIIRHLNSSIDYLQKEITKEELKKLKSLLDEKEPPTGSAPAVSAPTAPPPPESRSVPHRPRAGVGAVTPSNQILTNRSQPENFVEAPAAPELAPLAPSASSASSTPAPSGSSAPSAALPVPATPAAPSVSAASPAKTAPSAGLKTAQSAIIRKPPAPPGSPTSKSASQPVLRTSPAIVVPPPPSTATPSPSFQPSPPTNPQLPIWQSITPLTISDVLARTAHTSVIIPPTKSVAPPPPSTPMSPQIPYISSDAPTPSTSLASTSAGGSSSSPVIFPDPASPSLPKAPPTFKPKPSPRADSQPTTQTTQQDTTNAPPRPPRPVNN